MPAAIEAGYSDGYARREASRLLERPHIRDEIQRLTKRIEIAAVKTSTDVVDLLATIAFQDPIEFLKPDDMYPEQMMYKAPDELTKEQRACVKRIHIHKHFAEQGHFIRETYSYTFKDSERALENMGRHFGIFDDKLRLTDMGNNPLAKLPPERLAKLKEVMLTLMEAEGQVIEGEAQPFKLLERADAKT